MDINRLTDKTQEALQTAQSEAVRRNNQQVDVEHLLAALLAQKGGLAASILKRAGANVETLVARLDQELDRVPKVTGPSGTPDQIYVTQRLNALFTRAEDEAKRLKDDFISVEHFLLAAADDSKVFRELGITRDRIN
ncbi:MAG: Clp protease N-terminal domain-containing protein [Bryobacteraceae bacterium]